MIGNRSVRSRGLTDYQVGGTFNFETYHYMLEEFREEAPEIIEGKVSSYSNNSFTVRINVPYCGCQE
jgi:hypothetical protein